MRVDKRKKDGRAEPHKGAGKAQSLSAGIAQMQKNWYKFVVIDSKEFEKEVKSLLV